MLKRYISVRYTEANHFKLKRDEVTKYHLGSAHFHFAVITHRELYPIRLVVNRSRNKAINNVSSLKIRHEESIARRIPNQIHV